MHLLWFHHTISPFMSFYISLKKKKKHPKRIHIGVKTFFRFSDQKSEASKTQLTLSANTKIKTLENAFHNKLQSTLIKFFKKTYRGTKTIFWALIITNNESSKTQFKPIHKHEHEKRKKNLESAFHNKLYSTLMFPLSKEWRE